MLLIDEAQQMFPLDRVVGQNSLLEGEHTPHHL